MRIHLYVSLITVLFASMNTAYARQCVQFLKAEPAPAATTVLNTERENINRERENANKETGFAKNIESKDIIPTVERIIDVALETKLLNKAEARHLRHDLTELKSERNFKEDHPTFRDILGQWEIFISGLEGRIQEFKQMTPAEQKLWKSKMELPIYFSTAHFIVFLETRNNKHFDFNRMTTLLKVARGEETKGDIKLYLYAFEKQVRRYFSTREFRKCRA